MAGCPSCHSEFDAETIGGTTVAVCSACDGVWLTKGDLDRSTGLELEDQLTEWVHPPTECRYCRVSIGMSPRCVKCGEYPALDCPRGHGTMQTARMSIAGKEFEVDRCETCAGVWLDGHEQHHLADAPGPPPKVYSAVPTTPSHPTYSTEKTVQVIRDIQRRQRVQGNLLFGQLWKYQDSPDSGPMLVFVGLVLMCILFVFFLII